MKVEIEKIDHIGIAVKDLEAKIALWEGILGIKAGKIEELPERGVKLAHLHVPHSPTVELVTPLNEQAAVAKFLAKRGEGIHHFCFLVKNIESAFEELKKKGVEFVQDKPYLGAGGSRIVFIHPRSLGGVLIELKEKKKRTKGLLKRPIQRIDA
jgi:methylmalonyl-CoA/ethylmalonyl-CoA epimerase